MMIRLPMAAAASLMITLARPTVTAAAPPNVLMILADDYGWADIGYHVNSAGYPSTAAQKKEATTATPNIDQLVKDGVELDQAYVFKFCSPTRCSLQSGRNPIHANVMNIDPVNHNPADPVGGFSALARNLTGIAEVLKGAGYATAFAGKWDAGMATPQHTPRGRGYDQSLHYFHHANDYWSYQVGHCPSPKNKSLNVPVTDLWEGVLNGGEGPAHARVPGAPLNCPYYQDTNRSDCKYEDSVFTGYVMGVIEKHHATYGTGAGPTQEAGQQAAAGTPLFFCWTPHIVHSPLEVPAAYLSAFDWTGGRAAGGAAWNRQEYMAMVSYMDASIKNVTDLLKKNQMWDNTVLVFSADNGGPIYWSGVGGANNYPLKGGKASNYQGGVRVNSFVSGGLVPAAQRGKKLDGLVGIWDWYGTFASLAGVADFTDYRAAAAGLPPVDSVHGLWDYVSGKVKTSPRTVVHLGSCASADESKDPFCGKRVEKDPKGGPDKGAATTVQGVIHDERSTGGGLWKVLRGSLWQAGWTGPLFPNNTKGRQGKIPNFNDFHYNCSATAAGVCLFDLIKDPTEHEDRSSSEPALVAKLLGMLEEAQKGVYSVDRGLVDPASCTAAMGEYEGFWGPWLE